MLLEIHQVFVWPDLNGKCPVWAGIPHMSRAETSAKESARAMKYL